MNLKVPRQVNVVIEENGESVKSNDLVTLVERTKTRRVHVGI